MDDMNNHENEAAEEEVTASEQTAIPEETSASGEPSEGETAAESTEPPKEDGESEKPSTEPPKEDGEGEKPNTEPSGENTESEKPNTEPSGENTESEKPNTEPSGGNTESEKPNTEPPKEETDGKKKKKKKGRFPFWKRLCIFLLGMLIGITSTLGGIVGGGYWIYKNVSIEKLNEMGIAVALPESLQGKGEVDISTYTAAMLIADIMNYKSGSEELTVKSLSERYGLKLIADIEKLLPEEMASMPLGVLADGNALEQIFACLDFAYLLGLMPEGTFSEPMLEAMEGKNLSALGGGDMGEFLRDVKLGYLLSLTYEKQGDKWVLVLEEGKSKGLMEYMAGIDLSKLIGDESTDMLGLMKEEMADAPLSDVLGFATQGDDLLAGKTFGDIVVKDEATGKHSLRLAEAFDEVKFGTLAGYTEKNHVWQDENGEEASILMTRIFDHTVSEFSDGTFDFDDVTDGLTVGDIMGYTEKADGTYLDKDGKEAKGLNGILAETSLDALLDGTLTFDTLFEDERVGTLLNYTQDVRGNWYDEKGKLMTGLDASVANITMKQFFGKETVKAADVFAGVYMGEVMGFTVASYKSDGKTPDTWRDENGKPVDGFNADVANLKVGDLSDGDGVDFKEVFGDERVGDMQGHTYNASTGKWSDKNGNALDTLDSTIANMTVGDIIDGEINFKDAFRDEKIGNLQNYTYAGGRWYSDSAKTKPLPALDNVVAGWALGDLMNNTIDYRAAMEDVYVGELMGYTGTVGNWMNGKLKVKGLSAVIADLTFGELDDDTSMTHCLASAKVGDVMGYHKDGNVWKDEHGTEVSTVLGLLADKKISEMDESIHSWQLGDLMGYEKRGGEWTNPDGEVNTMMSHVADLYLDQLSDPDAVHEAVDGMMMCDILGYTKKADGWYMKDTKITGVMAYLAGHTVAELPYEVDHMAVSDIFGFTKRDGAWYDAKGQKITPFLASLADCHINDLDDHVNALTLGEVFVETDDGFFLILGADTKLVDLEARIDTVFGTGEGAATIGDFMDAGIVHDVTPAEAEKLALRIGADWRNMKVVSFINTIIDLVVQIP